MPSLSWHPRSRVSRKRRSAAAASCNKVSYELNLDLYKDLWHIQWPKKYEIHECTGTCEFPFPGNSNATNHSIALKTDATYNPDRPMEATVDCVPVDYGVFYYLVLNEYRILTTAFTKE